MTTEQIVRILQEHVVGATVAELLRRHAISHAPQTIGGATHQAAPPTGALVLPR